MTVSNQVKNMKRLNENLGINFIESCLSSLSMAAKVSAMQKEITNFTQN